MKFYIASSLRNIVNVKFVASALESLGHVQSYDWTMHTNVDSLSRLRDIGHEEVKGVSEADIVIIMIPAGKGSHVEMGIAIGQQKRVILYCSTDEMNQIGNTSTFYYIEAVEQCIGTLEDLMKLIGGDKI